MFLEYVGIAVVLALIVWGLNSGAARKVYKAIRSQVGKAGDAIEQADPVALLNQAVKDGAAQIQKAQQGLNMAKANVKSLERQIEAGATAERRLTTRIANPSTSQADAAAAAGELAQVKRDLASNRQQLDNTTKQYQAFLNQVKAGQKTVQDAQSKAGRLQVKLAMSENTKQMSQFASSFSLSEQQGDIANATAILESRIDQNNAAGEVIADLGGGTAADPALDDEAAALLASLRPGPAH